LRSPHREERSVCKHLVGCRRKVPSRREKIEIANILLHQKFDHYTVMGEAVSEGPGSVWGRVRGAGRMGQVPGRGDRTQREGKDDRFGCIKQKGTTPDLAPYDDKPRPLRPLKGQIAALRATLPDRLTGSTPRGLPAGITSPIPPAKHRGPGRLMSRKPGERPPWEVPFSRATAGIAAERGGEEREAIGDARSPVSPSPPPARSGTRSPARRPLPRPWKMVTGNVQI